MSNKDDIREIQQQVQEIRSIATALVTAATKIELKIVAMSVAPPVTFPPIVRQQDNPAPEPETLAGSQLPRGLGLKYVRDGVRTIAPNTIVSTTDIRRIVGNQIGHRPSFNTIRRAMEKLEETGELERVEGTDGWRVLAKLRSVAG